MKLYLLFFLGLLLFMGSDSAFAQARSKKRKSPAKVVQTVQPQTATTAIETEVVSDSTAKKNQRPSATNASSDNSKKNERTPVQAILKFPFSYEFSQPDFLVSHVVIEHDESGKGKITFERRELAEPLTDPIQINAAALERIKKLWQELNFLDSTETYQSAKYDYGHLGNMKLRMETGGKRREVAFNWTENKTAENLTKEYKRLTEHYIWLFDLNLARENQPLEAPKLMDRLESLIKRGEIYDGAELLPALREAKDDERIPLIARNHAERLIKLIEKMSEKKQ